MSLRYPKFAGKLPLAAFVLLATCAALPLSPVRAEDIGPGDSVGAVALPPGHSGADIKAALITAFLGRGWTIKTSDGSAVVGYINRHGVEAYLTAKYATDSVGFFSQAWKVDHAGNHEKPTLPTSWINYIKRDLIKDLERGSGRA